MKRFTCPFIFMLLCPIFCFADLGTCYSVHATVTTDRGVFNGYFLIVNDGAFQFEPDSTAYTYWVLGNGGRVSISQNENGKILLFGDEQEAFTSDFKAVLSDTFFLYPTIHYIFFAEDESDVPGAAGRPVTVARKEIKKLMIHSFRECSILYRSATALNEVDTWVTDSVFHIDDLGQTDCSYYAMYFSDPTDDAKDLVKQFQLAIQKQAEIRSNSEKDKILYRELSTKVSNIVAALKAKRVVIIFTCSC